MKASEVIAAIQECIRLNGDQEVKVRDGNDYKPVTIVEGFDFSTIVLECNA